MSGPTNRRFVRSAWTLIAFQFVAATGATGLAIWAATRVQGLVDQRDLLQARVSDLESHPAPPPLVPEAAPVEALPVENVTVAPAPPPPPSPAPVATPAPPPPPRPHRLYPRPTPVIVERPEVIYVPPPPPPPPPIKVEETPPPTPPPPPRPRRERPRITITPFLEGIIGAGRRRERQPQTQPNGQQPAPGYNTGPNRTVGPAGTTAVPGQTTNTRRVRRPPPDPNDPQPPR